MYLPCIIYWAFEDSWPLMVWPSTVMFVWKTWWLTITWPFPTWFEVKGGGGGGGGDGELNMGGGGMTPISVTAMERSGMSSMEAAEGSTSPLTWSPRLMAPGWLGVTLSLGSMDRGFTYFEPEIKNKIFTSKIHIIIERRRKKFCLETALKIIKISRRRRGFQRKWISPHDVDK